jgi:integrase
VGIAVDKSLEQYTEGTLHSLRHFLVTSCAERGVPTLTCMAWVGHRDAETAQGYYRVRDGSHPAIRMLEAEGAPESGRGGMNLA